VRSAAINHQAVRLLLAALSSALAGCGSATERILEERFEQIYTIEPTANVTVTNGDGAVFVYGSNTNDMRVEAIKRAYTRERLKQIAVDVLIQAGSVSINTKFPPQPKWALSDRSGTVDYTIVVPATATISALDLHAGEVLLDGMRGRIVRVRLGDGRIFARNCFTNVDLTMNRGTLTLSYDWWEEEKFSADVKVAQGNAWVSLPTDAAFHLFAAAAHGKIANDFSNLPISANASARSMKIDEIIKGGGSPTIQIRVEKGNIKIAEANP
jgi:hypothetical protein